MKNHGKSSKTAENSSEKVLTRQTPEVEFVEYKPRNYSAVFSAEYATLAVVESAAVRVDFSGFRIRLPDT